MLSPWTPLQTERLTLRRFQRSDAHAFAAYRSHPEVARYQGWDAPYSVERALQFMDEMGSVAAPLGGEWFQIAIALKKTNRLIGDFGIRLTHDEQQAELGLTLATEHQGCGYASEAMQRLLEHLFSICYLHRVYANCDVENPAAQRALERLGFRREAHFIENLWFKGRWASEYWYGLLQQEWRAAGR